MGLVHLWLWRMCEEGRIETIRACSELEPEFSFLSLSIFSVNLQLVGGVAVEGGEGVGVVGGGEGEVWQGNWRARRRHNWNSPFRLLSIARNLHTVWISHKQFTNIHFCIVACFLKHSPYPTCFCKPTHTRGPGWCCGWSTRPCRRSPTERTRARSLLVAKESLVRSTLMITILKKMPIQLRFSRMMLNQICPTGPLIVENIIWCHIISVKCFNVTMLNNIVSSASICGPWPNKYVMQVIVV